jgi:hypothetical protein
LVGVGQRAGTPAARTTNGAELALQDGPDGYAAERDRHTRSLRDALSFTQVETVQSVASALPPVRDFLHLQMD